MTGHLTIEHNEIGNTLVRDEEGDLLFTLPGTHDATLCTTVDRIRRGAMATGERIGREAMAQDLRRLIGAAEVPRG